MLKQIQTLLFILFCLSSISAFAQRTVSGTVKDADGQPVIGATVLEDGTTNGAITDVSGKFTLQVAGSASVIRVSFIGYKTATQVVGSQSSIEFLLEEDADILDEVVVTALGLEEKKDNLGYAISEVEGEKLVKSGEATLANALSGKTSGVRITRNSGDPGAGAYIQIRGLSTITRDAQPLIVVDGIPVSNDVRGNSSSGGVNQESRLNDINPNDIESISVLKGAAAAALYGTQALGGVILITTKSGKTRSRTTVTFKSTFSIDVINRKYPLQTKFGQGDNGVYDQRARDSWGDKIADRTGGEDEINASGPFYVDQDGRSYFQITNKNSQEIYDDANFDQIFENGYFFENNLSISGGSEKASVFFSLGDLNQDGIIKNNSDYRRTSARLNVGYDFSDKVQLKVKTAYTRTNSNRIQKGANSSGLYLGLLRTPPDFDNSGYRGDFFAGPDAAPIPNRHRSYREPLGADETPTYNNPNWTINEQVNEAKVNRFINSMELNYSPLNWLDLIGRVGIDHYTEDREQFFTPGSASGSFRPGFLQQELAENTIFNMDFIAQANKEFSRNFQVNGLVGFNYRSNTRRVSEITLIAFDEFTDVASGVRDVDNASPENVNRTSVLREQRIAGVYSSLSFSLWNQVYVTGTLRAESASTLDSPEADNDISFLYPSVSVNWQFSEFGNLSSDIFSFGKVRFSYGEVGVQPGPYDNNNLFISNPTFGDTFGGDLNTGLYGNGARVPANTRGNVRLVPERKKEIEIGTDLRFLSDRLSLSFTYFSNKTEDVLLNFPVANSRGYSVLYTNGAEIENKGIEADLGFRVLDINDFSWDVSVNYTRVRNEVTDLRGAESINLGGLAAVNARAVEGQPLGVLFGSRIQREEDGSIVFDANGFPEQDNVDGVIGDPNPNWQGAINTTIRYKNFSLRALFETYQGADIYAGTKSVLFDLGRWSDSGNEVTATRNYRTFDDNIIFIGETFRGNVADFGAGPVALTEAWYNGPGGFFGSGIDELYIEDGSWTRLRELSLTYSLNNEWLNSNLGIDNVEFTVTGRNLVLWTKFEGNDPDTNLSGVSNARGIDYFNNPGTKSYIFSLLLTF